MTNYPMTELIQTLIELSLWALLAAGIAGAAMMLCAIILGWFYREACRIFRTFTLVAGKLRS
jgi:hypothetical protein